jgi:hypothetical protein
VLTAVASATVRERHVPAATIAAGTTLASAASAANTPAATWPRASNQYLTRTLGIVGHRRCRCTAPVADHCEAVAARREITSRLEYW